MPHPLCPPGLDNPYTCHSSQRSIQPRSLQSVDKIHTLSIRLAQTTRFFYTLRRLASSGGPVAPPLAGGGVETDPTGATAVAMGAETAATGAVTGEATGAVTDAATGWEGVGSIAVTTILSCMHGEFHGCEDAMGSKTTLLCHEIIANMDGIGCTEKSLFDCMPVEEQIQGYPKRGNSDGTRDYIHRLEGCHDVLQSLNAPLKLTQLIASAG